MVSSALLLCGDNYKDFSLYLNDKFIFQILI